jgi:hypothetical protein
MLWMQQRTKGPEPKRFRVETAELLGVEQKA